MKLGRHSRHLGVVILLVAATCLDTTRAQSRRAPEFRVLVPRFESEAGPDLGYNVAFALNHEIFRTFKQSIPKRPDGRYDPDDQCCLRYKAVSYLGDPIPEQTHAAARHAAGQTAAQLVVWGKAWNYGRDVVVQPFLTIASPPEGMTTSVRVGTFGAVHPFGAKGRWQIWPAAPGEAAEPIEEFPSTAYELPPIVFDSSVLQSFRSFEGMPVYEEKDTKSDVVGRTGTRLEADRHEGEWTRITSPRGWIRMPDLRAGATVSFVDGLVNFMRANWPRARIAFSQVMETSDAPTQVRIDAALLLAATLARLDPACGGCDDAIRFAERFNPYSQLTQEYRSRADLALASARNVP